MNLAFIGAGKMATAIIKAVSEKNLSDSIIATGLDAEKLKEVKDKFNIKTTLDNKEAVNSSDIVFICVHPNEVDGVLDGIGDIAEDKLIVSIAAGISLERLQSKLSSKRIIRVMPNVNCIAGEMAAGFTPSKGATANDVKEISSILDACGLAFQVDEELLDAVTGISGAGPAFYAYFIESFASAAVDKGLSKDIAMKLAAQTCLGTGKMILDEKYTADQIMKMVATKKGATMEGLKVLDSNKTKKILKETFNAVYNKCRELGK